MAKRMIVMLSAVVFFVVVVGGVKAYQIHKAMSTPFVVPPQAVTTTMAKQETWPEALHNVGSASAVQGVTVSADLPGVVDKIAFESGRPVKAGEVLVQLDARQEQAQLAAAQAQLDLARANQERMQGLLGKGVTSKAEADRAAAELKQAEARVGEVRATIERKTVRAPFTGVLGIRLVNVGQYLDGGKPIVPLQSIDPIHVDFSVPQQQAAAVKIGAEVKVSAEGLAKPVTAKVTAVDSVVDEATRNVKIQATAANADGRLRPGMFVTADLSLGSGQSVIELPSTSIMKAPYGDSVFIVEDITPEKGGKPYKGARQQFVKLGLTRGDQVAILDGVKAGQEVVTAGVFKLRNNISVLVNNDVQPSNNPAPKPEDN
jgi:membrane fusion protein (multidrug efflux system)